MFPFAIARRPASLRLSLTSLRVASTKPTAKAQIKKAISDPAPPVFARYPRLYYTLQAFKWGLGFVLGLHIFVEYFFVLALAEGISMQPTMNATGDWLLLSKRYRRGRDVQVGDIVSFKHPVDQDTFGVKRVIGMPGDLVLRDSPDTSGMMIQIPDGHCYVVGDNLKFSRDSRMFGPLPLGLIKAKVVGVLSSSESKWKSFNDSGLKPAQDMDDLD